MEEVTIERRRRRKEGKSERAGARDGRRVREAAGRQNTEAERERRSTDKNLAHLTHRSRSGYGTKNLALHALRLA